MRIAVACDHAAFLLKEVVIRAITEAGHQPLDLGTGDSIRHVDYPDFAARVGQAIVEGQAERGILLCGSGVGACIAANKIDGIYAGLCHDIYSAAQGVEDDNMNVLCLGALIIGPSLVPGLVRAFINARFTSEKRHQQQIDKIRWLERQRMKGRD